MKELVALVDIGMERACHEGYLNQEEYDAWQTLKAAVLAKQTNNSAMDAIRKAYIEGYSMGHHHTVESCYCPEQAADDWLSEQHQ